MDTTIEATKKKRAKSLPVAEVRTRIEETLRTGETLSASEVATRSGLPQLAVARALADMRTDAAVTMTGNRRSAKYLLTKSS